MSGRTVVVGEADLLASRDVTVPAETISLFSDRAAPGRTVVPVAVDGEIGGLLVFAETLHPEAASTVAELRSMGIRTVLLSGDNQPTAERVAREVRIDEVYGGVLPGGKGEIVAFLPS